MTCYIIRGHFVIFKLDGFQLMAMIVGLNWLLMGLNVYHYFYTRIYALV